MLNKVVVIGNITKDIELKYVGEKAVANFDIAVNDGYGDKKSTYYFKVVVWGKSAEALSNYAGKGSKISVLGKLTQRTYTANNGQKASIVEIVADSVNGIEFLDVKKDSSRNTTTASTMITREDISFLEEPFDLGPSPF